MLHFNHLPLALWHKHTLTHTYKSFVVNVCLWCGQLGQQGFKEFPYLCVRVRVRRYRRIRFMAWKCVTHSPWGPTVLIKLKLLEPLFRFQLRLQPEQQMPFDNWLLANIAAFCCISGSTCSSGRFKYRFHPATMSPALTHTCIHMCMCVCLHCLLGQLNIDGTSHLLPVCACMCVCVSVDAVARQIDKVA